MKKIMTTVMALTLALGMSVTAFAAPSVSQGGATSTVVSVSSKELTTTSTIEAAQKEADKLASSGKKAEQIAALEIVIDEATEESPVTITLAIPAVKMGDSVFAMHLLKNGTWKKEIVTVTKDGECEMTVTECSPFVFYKEVAQSTVNKDTSAGAQSPSASGTAAKAVDKNEKEVSVSSTPMDVTSAEGKRNVEEAYTAAERVKESYEELHQIAALDVICDAATPENPVTITFMIPGVASNDKIIVMHKTAAGWIQEKVVTPKNGAVDVTVTSCSPFVFYRVTGYDGWAGVSASDKAKMMGETKMGATSPKTGDVGVIGYAFIAVACGAALVFTKKKVA